jgi:hypothetical protein
MGRALGLVLFAAAGIALFAYELFEVALLIYRSRLMQGAALLSLVALLAWRAWERRG